ncbi:hypothetical protein SAMN05421665_1626 [Yoonia rosea]|uniref:Uncharacterized protein n=1 Tax=Yoonia rosea TaxID=287098 RepID=A0A1R3WZJ5_9RHOB|nr:hypothetical protein SAMN05421665_1626 [Yoonia rosea]
MYRCDHKSAQGLSLFSVCGKELPTIAVTPAASGYYIWSYF